MILSNYKNLDQLKMVAGAIIGSLMLAASLSMVSVAQASGLTQETWSLPGAAGKQVSQTINQVKIFPLWSPPTGTEADERVPNSSITASNFDITLPGGFNHYHGERVHGYLTARVTGVHKFFVSGNKDVELYINYDDNGNGSPTTARGHYELTKVAEMVRGDDANSFYDWYTSNDYDWYRWGQAPSKDVMLTAGQRYYVAAITKAVCCRSTANQFQVAWQEPAGGIQSAAPVSGDSANVIPGSVLTEFTVVDEAPVINLNADDPLSHEAGVEYVESASCEDDIDAACSVSVTDWGGFTPSNPIVGTYTLTLTTSADSGGNVGTRSHTIEVRPAGALETGGLTHDVWSLPGAAGKQVSQTINQRKIFPLWSPPTGLLADEVAPNTSVSASNFDITLPSGFNHYHGERVHGYLIPKVSGVHRFFVSGNKDVELYLNYDENGNGTPTSAREHFELTKVAEMVQGNDENSFYDWYTSNDYDWYRWGQAPIKEVMLNAGQVYYIAAITKAVCCRSAANQFQVAWQEPAGGIQSAAPISGDGANVIRGEVLSEFVFIDEPPLISLNTGNPLQHVAGIEYTDQATCTDDLDAPCSVSVTDWGGLDRLNPQEGNYTLTLTSMTDRAGNASTATRVVTVFMDEAPVINLNSDNPLDHAAGEEYIDLATCTDDRDATCNVSVSDWGGMDRLNPQAGSYTLILTTQPDSAGNVGTATRVVEVIFIDNAPIIQLNSPSPLNHPAGESYLDLATCTDDRDATCSVSVSDWGGMDSTSPVIGRYVLTLSTSADSVGNVRTATRTVNVARVNTNPQGIQQTAQVFNQGEHFMASTKSASIRQSGYLGSSAYQGPQDMYSLAAKDPENADTDSFFLAYQSFYKPSELGAAPNAWSNLYNAAPHAKIHYSDYRRYGVVSRFSKQGSESFNKQETVSFKDKCETVHGMTASQNGKLVAVLCRGYPGPNQLKPAVKDPFAGLPFTDLTPTGGFTDGPHLASMYILEYRDGRITDTPDHVIRVSKAAGGWNYGNDEVDYVCDTEGGCTCDASGDCEGGSYFVHIKVQTNNPDNQHENLYKYIINRPADLVNGSYSRQYARESCGGGHPQLYRKAYNSHQKAWGQTCYLDQRDFLINTLPADAQGRDTSNYTSQFITRFAKKSQFTTSGGPFTLMSLGEDGYMTLMSGPAATEEDSQKVGFYLHRVPGEGGGDELKWPIGADQMSAIGITDIGRFGYVKAAPFGHTDIASIEDSERFLVGFSPNIDAAGGAKPEVFVVAEVNRQGELIGNASELVSGAAWGQDNNWSALPSSGCIAYGFVDKKDAQTAQTRYPVQSQMDISDPTLPEDQTLWDRGFTKNIQINTLCPETPIVEEVVTTPSDVLEFLQSQGDVEAAMCAPASSSVFAESTGRSINHTWSRLDFNAKPSMLLPSLVAHLQSNYGGDSSGLRTQNLTHTGFDVFVEEEQSRDNELTHTTENVGFMAMGHEIATAIRNAAGEVIGEIGADPLDVTDVWQTVTFTQGYDAVPVVVAYMQSYAETDPSHVRIRNVTSTGFEMSVQEWDYKDGSHAAEQVNYVVMAQGLHAMRDNQVIAVSKGDINQSQKDAFTNRGYTSNLISLGGTPTVMAQVQSFNDPSAAVIRLRNITTTSVQVLLEEEEASDGIHGTESVGIIAVSGNSTAGWGVDCAQDAAGVATDIRDVLEAILAQIDNASVTTTDWEDARAAIDQLAEAYANPEVNPDFINFDAIQYGSYISQDKPAEGTVTIDESGTKITLDGNRWQKAEIAYTITPNTVLEFDYKSNIEGEVQGIGFDTDEIFSPNRLFQLFGTQNVPNAIVDYQYTDVGNLQSFKINVGAYFTGVFDYLILVNDDDEIPQNSDSEFSNIRLYEGAGTVLDYFADGPSPSAVEHHFTCPENSVLSQLDASFDPQVVDSLSFACSPLNDDGSTGAPVSQSLLGYANEYGTIRGNTQSLPCSGRMITGLRGRAGQRVDQIGHHCSDLTQMLAGTAEPGLGDPFGSTTGGSPVDQRCGAGKVATGAYVWINSNYGDIGDIRLICNDFNTVSGQDDTVLDYFADGPSPSAVEHHFTCPENSVLSQLDASFDPQVVDSLSFACSPLNDDGSTGAPVSQSLLGYANEYGTIRGNTQSLPCSGRMITGLRGRAGQRVDQIGHHCSDLTQMLAGTAEPGLGDPFGSTTGGSPVDQRCGAGKVATGAYVWVNSNYGDIGDIRLICTNFNNSIDLSPAVIIQPEAQDDLITVNQGDSLPVVTCLDPDGPDPTPTRVGDVFNTVIPGLYRATFACTDVDGIRTERTIDLEVNAVVTIENPLPVPTDNTLINENHSFNGRIGDSDFPSNSPYDNPSAAVDENNSTFYRFYDPGYIWEGYSYAWWAQLNPARKHTNIVLATDNDPRIGYLVFVRDEVYSSDQINSLLDRSGSSLDPSKLNQIKSDSSYWLEYNSASQDFSDNGATFPQDGYVYVIRTYLDQGGGIDALFDLLEIRSVYDPNTHDSDNDGIFDSNEHSDCVTIADPQCELRATIFDILLQLAFGVDDLESNDDFLRQLYLTGIKNCDADFIENIYALGGSESVPSQGQIDDALSICEDPNQDGIPGGIFDGDDADGDGRRNLQDLCPFDPSDAPHSDADGDGVGDDCEGTTNESFNVCFLSPDEVGVGKNGLCPSSGAGVTRGEKLISADNNYYVSINKGLKIIHTVNGAQIVDTLTDRESWRTEKARLTIDGNFELLDRNDDVLWSTETSGSNANYMYLDNQGFLSLECIDGSVVWSSNVSRIETSSCENPDVSGLTKTLEMADKMRVTTELLCQSGDDIVSKCPAGKRYQFLSITDSYVKLQDQEQIERDFLAFLTGLDLNGGSGLRFLIDAWTAQNVSVTKCLDRTSLSLDNCFINDAVIDEESLFSTSQLPTGISLEDFGDKLTLGNGDEIDLTNVVVDGTTYVVNQCHRHTTNLFYLDSVGIFEQHSQNKGQFVNRYFPKQDCILDGRNESLIIGSASNYQDQFTRYLAGTLQVIRFAEQAAILSVPFILSDGLLGVTLVGTELEFLINSFRVFNEVVGFSQGVYGVATDLFELSSCQTDVCKTRAITDIAMNGLMLGQQVYQTVRSSGKSVRESRASDISETMIDLASEVNRSNSIISNVDLSTNQLNYYRIMALAARDENFATIMKVMDGNGDTRLFDAVTSLSDSEFKSPKFVEKFLIETEAIVEDAENGVIDENRLQSFVDKLNSPCGL